MSKIFEFRPGSYVDPISGAVGVNTNGTIEKTEKGLAWKGLGLNTEIVFNAEEPLSGAESVEFAFKTQSQERMGILGGIFGAYMVFITSGRIGTLAQSTDNATASAAGNFADGDWHHCVITRTTPYITFYIDGNEVTLGNSGDWRVSVTTTIGTSGGTGSLWFDGDIGKATAYNHTLTSEERALLYRDFLRAMPITKTIR